MSVSFNKNIYLINHVSAEALIIERVIPSGTNSSSSSFCVHFSHLRYLPESQIQKFFLFIQTNSFINFTCLNPVLLSQASSKWVSVNTASRGIDPVIVIKRK